MKFVRPYVLPNLARYVFCSNMRLPVFLDPDDRRYAVCKTLKENKIHSHIGRAIKRWAVEQDGAAAIRHYLENVHLGTFDPTANPPWTEDKTRLVADSRSALLTFTHDLMADEERPAIATMTELMHAAKDELETTPTLKALANALDDAGAIALPRVRLWHGGRKHTVYSLKGPFADVREGALRATLNSEAHRREQFFHLIMPVADKPSKFTRPPTTDNFTEDDDSSSAN